MSKFITVPFGDIKLTVAESGSIILDSEGGDHVRVQTGPGSFVTSGSLTNLNSDNTVVSDPKPIINYGESGDGIENGSGASGLIIDRGTLKNASMTYDESYDGFVFGFSDGSFSSIVVPLVKSDSDFTIDPAGLIRTTSNYLDKFNNASDVSTAIPNAQWVTDEIDHTANILLNTYKYKISSTVGDTHVKTFDSSENTGPDSTIDFVIDGDKVGEITSNSFDFNYLSIDTFVDDFGSDPMINSRVPGKDLILRATGEDYYNYGSVRVDHVFELTGQMSKLSVDYIAYPGFSSDDAIDDYDTAVINPDMDYTDEYGDSDAYVLSYTSEPLGYDIDDYMKRFSTLVKNPNGVKIIGAPENTGGTGIFFVNGNSTRDELVSRQRSLFFSMLF